MVQPNSADSEKTDVKVAWFLFLNSRFSCSLVFLWEEESIE
ncbi:MAG: hypothetical protein ACJAWV_003238 [Flammeovirgaceae bacterium]|jgi:hypothetical protein